MENKPLFLYSGNCLVAKCGIETTLKDDQGNTLHTGDIVLLWLNQGEEYAPVFYGLTAIVEDKYTTYSDGNIKIDKDGQPFVMGIKECKLGDEWYVETVKKWSDAIPGEHWSRFGFRYANGGQHD